MAISQTRQELNELRKKALDVIRAALPENLANLLDEILFLDVLSTMAESGDLTSRKSDYVWHHIEKLKGEIENATRNPRKEITELMTVEEAAEVTKVSLSTIYRMVREGELKAIRFGRLVRFDRADLENFLARNVRDG